MFKLEWLRKRNYIMYSDEKVLRKWLYDERVDLTHLARHSDISLICRYISRKYRHLTNNKFKKTTQSHSLKFVPVT
ncbi:hypothetical protein PUN28_004408 [Cardiocondyla obscurior]|uniref:Uncharacterized protein n=1 Tax=Cardiocondyla obscurior TaxID=286306 RepID=A0AAW2GB68_9HYME